MERKRYLLSILLLVITFPSSFAQTYRKGKEEAKGTVNLAELARYEEKHPVPYKKKAVIKEAEGEYEEHEVEEADPALVRVRPARPVAKITAGGPLLPVTFSPADTFLAVTSPGTSIPPDTHGNVDSTYCVTADNANIRVQSRTGTNLYTATLDGFWGSSLLASTSSFDPRVHYDPYTKRWFIVAVSTSGDFSVAKILIAASATGNPTGTWYKFAINVSSGGNWLDFPNVGFNSKWIVVTGNYFTAAGASVNASAWCFNKATLMAGSSASNVQIGSISAFTLAPAQTYDPASANIFLLNIGNRGASSGGQLQLRKISGPVGSPVLSSVIGSPSAGSLPAAARNWKQNGNGGSDFAPQLGTTQKLQTNDDRINNCVFRNGKVWCSHNVFYPFSGTTNQRSSIMWWQIDTTGTPNQVGVIDDPTAVKFYSFPSIAVNSSNDALLGFSTFSSSIYPSAAYALHMHSDPVDSMRPMFIYRHGQKSYYRTFGGTENRWGDYSGTCVDPRNDNDFWTIQESVPNYSGAISSSLWDTWWARVQVCPTPAAPVLASSPATLCAGASGTYAVTPITGATGYTWAVSGTGWSGSSTTTSISLLAGTGVATISVAASNSCGLGEALVFLDTPATAPAAPTVATVTPACAASATASFSATSTGATSYNWTVTGTGWSGSSTTSSLTATVGTGTGTITVTASNACGTSTVTTVAVPIGDVPGADTNIVVPSPLCSGSAATISTTAVAGATSYTWTVTGTGWSGSGTTSTPSTSITPGTTTGTITVTPVNACGSGVSFTVSSITPVITPTASFTLSSHAVTFSGSVTATYTGTASSTATYAWSFGTAGYPGSATTVGPHTFHWTTAGTKTVTLTVTDNGCTSTSTAATDTVRVGTVGIAQTTAPQINVSVVPNPSNGSFSLLFDKQVVQPLTVTLYDVQGRVVYRNEFNNVNSNKVSIDAATLPAGNYAASIIVDGTIVSRKVSIGK
jgi:hypothetical protein